LVITLKQGSGRDTVFFHFFPGYLTFTFTWFAGWQSAGAIFSFAWSLSMEEQFYVFWAAILRFFRAPLPAIAMMLLIALRAATDAGLTARVVPVNSLPWRMAENIAIPICLGALLAQMLHSRKIFGWLKPVMGQRWSAPASFVLLVASLVPNGGAWAWLQWPA